MDVGQVGRVLLVIAAIAGVAGLVLLAANAMGIGRLPGDIAIRRGSFRFYVPIATSIILSIVATIVLNVLFRR